MKKNSLLLFFFLFPLFLQAQKKNAIDEILIIFDSVEYHFGSVEQGTIVEHDFHFTNKGREPFRFTEGHTSTSAAIVSYPLESVGPGVSGKISYRFDTNGKMGPQEKTASLSISCGMKDSVIVLRIKGNVFRPPDPNAPVPVFDSVVYDFGTVLQGTIIEHDFKFTNKGKLPIVISNATGSCNCDDEEYSKEPVPPGKSATVRYRFDTQGKMGYQDKIATITFTNSEVQTNYSENRIVIHTCGHVIRDTTNAPFMKFDSTSYHFGKIHEGEILEHEFHFKNTGKTPLVIMECHSACNCDNTNYPQDPIPPGESGVIKYRLDTNGRSGPQSKTITISYYPEQIIVLHVYGEIIPAANGN
ncbi:MAG: DUF1573 domain-containing protein [Bacteroidetes bacterium]|nr:DUF1573 domain-containing protein [Bacteroidota bacterium]